MSLNIFFVNHTGFVKAVMLLLSNSAIFHQITCMTGLFYCHYEVVFSYLIRGALAHVAWVADDDALT